MTASRTDDGWQNARHLNLYLRTRTRYLMAETRDPKVFLIAQPTIRFPVSPRVMSLCLG